MTIYELELEYEKMCDLQKHCNTCKYDDDNASCALVYGFEKGKAVERKKILDILKTFTEGDYNSKECKLLVSDLREVLWEGEQNDK